MELIGRYKNSGFEAVADGVVSFFDRRKELLLTELLSDKVPL